MLNRIDLVCFVQKMLGYAIQLRDRQLTLTFSQTDIKHTNIVYTFSLFLFCLFFLVFCFFFLVFLFVFFNMYVLVLIQGLMHYAISDLYYIQIALLFYTHTHKVYKRYLFYIQFFFSFQFSFIVKKISISFLLRLRLLKRWYWPIV